MKYLTSETIDPQQFLTPPEGFHRGASVLFFGIVRDHTQLDHQHKQVSFLEYEAYEPMAERLIEELVQSATQQWPLDHVRLQHRLGRVPLGGIAVAIEVSSPHRDEAYRASRYLIDEIKHRVPIWKKEFFSDGLSHWSLCTHANPDPHSHRDTVHRHPPASPIDSLLSPATQPP